MCFKDDAPSEEVFHTEEWHRYCTARHALVQRLGVVCRMFLADDPKAELAKMVTEVSDLLEFPNLETADEWRCQYFEWLARENKIFLRDLSAVSAFLAKSHAPLENQTN
jgi:hypothetical protein